MAIAYHSLVGSSGPVSSASSLIGCGGEFRIDAARSEEEHLPRRPSRCAALQDVRLDHQVVVEKIGAEGVVGEDAADLGRGEEDRVRPRFRDPALRLRLAGQVERCRGRRSGPRSPRAARRRTSAEPTMPRWPATQTRLPARLKGRLLGIPALLLGDDREILAHHLRAERVEVGRVRPAELAVAPCSGRPAADRPRSGGNSADRSRRARGPCRPRCPSRSALRPRQAISTPISANACSTKERTEWRLPVAST